MVRRALSVVLMALSAAGGLRQEGGAAPRPAVSPSDESVEAQRFEGCRRLYGAQEFARVEAAHVAVVGLGGVGSWCVEALARSGVGALTVVDLDDVCVSNVNRQLCATTSSVGRFKAEVVAERCRDISPRCEVRPVLEFVDESNVEAVLFARPPTCVVDAIDAVADKVAILEACAARNVPVVCVGAAGGRGDPTRVRIGQGLDRVAGDPLLRAVRKRLDADARAAPLAIYSEEKAQRLGDDLLKRTGCDHAFGTLASVTAAFGLAAAKAALDLLLVARPDAPRAAEADDEAPQSFLFFEEADCPCSDLGVGDA